MPKNCVRIIGGTWRGKKLYFPNLPSLRPTPDRVRETLFNWLAPFIADTHCLDLFAGSGALGFEALSRGAACVTFVDQSIKVIRYLEEQVKSLQVIQHVALLHATIPKPHLHFKFNPFDIVFLDPPFHQCLIDLCIDWLIRLNLVKQQAILYLETESQLSLPSLPGRILKNKTSGQVNYYLVQLML
jgi:16S rRNA (guanine966-N2)-methyltransferase